ncbi:MAG TPA: hypothetical protein VJB90_04505 [Candidatus Nanoarchaeia archaeon]|nr:hypothetical protein [Candidatus Nanoarchaeia archaeon]
MTRLASVGVRESTTDDTWIILLKQSFRDDELDRLLGNSDSIDTHLRTQRGEELYFKVVPSREVIDYIHGGIYAPQNQAGYVMNGDLEAELLHLRPGSNTLLVMPNTRHIAQYSLPGYNGRLNLDPGKRIPFDQTTVSHLFVFEKNEGVEISHALQESPGSSPMHVVYRSTSDALMLRGLDGGFQELQAETSSQRSAHQLGIQTAAHIVREYLGNL